MAFAFVDDVKALRPLRSLREIHPPRPPRTPREVLALRALRTPRGRSLRLVRSRRRAPRGSLLRPSLRSPDWPEPCRPCRRRKGGIRECRAARRVRARAGGRTRSTQPSGTSSRRGRRGPRQPPFQSTPTRCRADRGAPTRSAPSVPPACARGFRSSRPRARGRRAARRSQGSARANVGASRGSRQRGRVERFSSNHATRPSVASVISVPSARRQ